MKNTMEQIKIWQKKMLKKRILDWIYNIPTKIISIKKKIKHTLARLTLRNILNQNTISIKFNFSVYQKLNFGYISIRIWDMYKKSIKKNNLKCKNTCQNYLLHFYCLP